MKKFMVILLSMLISGCAAINPNYANYDDTFDLWWQKEFYANRQACLDSDLLISNLSRNIDERTYSLTSGEVCDHASV